MNRPAEVSAALAAVGLSADTPLDGLIEHHRNNAAQEAVLRAEVEGSSNAGFVEADQRKSNTTTSASPTASERERAVPTFEIRERAIAAMEAEMTRLIGSDDLEPERLGDETPEHFVARRCFEVMAKTTELGLMGYVECGAATASGPCVRERDHNPPHQSHIRFIAYPDERVRADHTEASPGERDGIEVYATIKQPPYLWIVCRDCCEAWPYDERAERSCECTQDHRFVVAEMQRDWPVHPEAQPGGDVAAILTELRVAIDDGIDGEENHTEALNLIERALAALASSEAQPQGDICEVCGRGEGYGWHVDRVVWNAVQPNGRGVVCPVCFARKAEAAGVEMAVVGLTASDYRRWVCRDDEGNPLPPAWPDEHWSEAQPGEPAEAEVAAAARAVVAERQDYDAWDDYSPAERAKVLREQRAAYAALAAARSTRGEGGDG